MTKHENLYTPEQQEELIDAHVGTSLDTPLRSDAFDLSAIDDVKAAARDFTSAVTSGYQEREAEIQKASKSKK